MKTTNKIRISIITVCRNSELYIEETIRSVIGQHYPHIEYIIVDGKSTDNTVPIIRKYEHRIAMLIIEEDRNMYQAINKGIRHATGDYILVLNSDDTLFDPTVIGRVAEAIESDKLDYYHCNICKWKEPNIKKVRLFGVNFRKLLFSRHSTFISHPTLFISNTTNEELNGYDEDYDTSADQDYILRLLKLPQRKGRHLEIFTTRFRLRDDSLTSSGKMEAERISILRKHGYYEHGMISRWYWYLKLWLYYKWINRFHFYQADQ